MNMTALDLLREELEKENAYPVFLTGAGISLASGIPTFRGTDEDAIWEHDVLEMGTNYFFQRNPEKSWQWYLSRFEKCWGAEPNPAHHAVHDILKTAGHGTVVTQNIDGLHHQVGGVDLIECHGSARNVRCTNYYCEFGPPKGLIPIETVRDRINAFQADPKRETVPRCPGCAKFLRPHVLWFDESYSSHESYGFEEFERVIDSMTVLIFVGTSFAVTVTDLFLTSAFQLAIPIYNIDPGAKPLDFVTLIKEKAEDVLPRLTDFQRAPGGSPLPQQG